MIWFVYNCLFPIVYLLMLPRFLIRMYRRGGYRRGFLQRLGLYDQAVISRLQSRQRIWIHAVSVGEVFVALRFMEAVRDHRPDTAFVLTTNTSTGHAIAVKQIGPDDILLYFPVDLPLIIRRVLNRLRPQALVLVEGELWPNLIRQANQRGIPVMLLNGRLSDRSYRRYQKIRFLIRRLLASITLFCVQGEDERRRLIELGADPARIRVMGSAKYDVAAATPAPASTASTNILRHTGLDLNAQLLVGGSTWPGEEAILLELYQKLRTAYPAARLVLAPRHMERAGAVVAEIEKTGLAFQRWSVAAHMDQLAVTPAPEVLLVDTTGDLQQFYAAATIIFIGKSLTAHGGQNVIEAAAHAKPIVVGPHMENFRSVMADFLSAKALIQVRNKQGLECTLIDLWSHADKRREYGERARRVVRDKAGAIQASVALFLGIAENP